MEFFRALCSHATLFPGDLISFYEFINTTYYHWPQTYSPAQYYLLSFMKNLNMMCEQPKAKLTILESYFPQKMVQSLPFPLFPAFRSPPSPDHAAVTPCPVSMAFSLSPLSYLNHHHFPPTVSSKWSFPLYSVHLLICSRHSL